MPVKSDIVVFCLIVLATLAVAALVGPARAWAGETVILHREAPPPRHRHHPPPPHHPPQPAVVVIESAPTVVVPPAPAAAIIEAAPAMIAPPTDTAAKPYCREYQNPVVVDGKLQSSYGTACLQPDGSWKIVSQNP